MEFNKWNKYRSSIVNKYYYFNTITEKTQWDIPSDIDETITGSLDSGWEVKVSKKDPSLTYYFNTITGISTCIFPGIIKDDKCKNVNCDGKMDRTELPLECWVEKGQIPKELILNKEEYDILWDSHPEKYHKIKIFNKLIDTPRWQQAYGKSYSFSGNVSTAKPFTNLLNTFLDWANHNESINGRSPTLNGILVNWYQDGDHYIGWHSDDESQIDGTSPIYTISLGINRTFKIRDKSTKTTKDYEFYNGDYFIMGGKFQKFYQHHVPKRTRCKNSRISITIRKFL